MSTIQILLHILPREIDELERICDHLHRSSFFLSPDDKVNLDITLNLSNEFTDWDKSLLPKEFFIEKFKSIEIKSDWTNKNIFELNYDKICMGCNDKRRNSIRKYSDSVSHFLYLDPDVSFPMWGLYYMFRAIESINSEYYMITGETQRLWDESWDCIVNKRYLNTPIGPEDFSKLNLRAYKKFDPYKIDKEFFDNIGDTKIKPINNFKFGGGWFNVFSSNMLKFIDIPDELGSYGLDDTYVLQCAQLMGQKGYDIKQYVIENLLVCESRKYKKFPTGMQKENVEVNPYNKLLVHNINQEDRQKFAKLAQEKYPEVINRFTNKL